ncbi:MAG: hypothetical protein JXQ83_02940 [Candidatus Glassbacteria bacterium]|nr:hypothetical protein [Candidatus Glassbacteria bacterium]
MYAVLIFLAGLLVAVSCTREPSAQERAKNLAGASLKMVRLEQQALARGEDPQSVLGQAENIFLETVRLEPEAVAHYLKTGSGTGREQLEDFLAAASGLPRADSRDDPAAVIMELFSEAPETRGNTRGLLDGYAAAFQMCLELERDGTVMQDFLPFLLALGCPLTLRDLGLESSGRPRLEELAAAASPKTGKQAYSTAPFDYFITMIKIDSWAGKFNGQVTADTLASGLLKDPGLKPALSALARLPALRLGFLGDSNMDPIHWSTQAPFPDIVAAVLDKVNPKITVTNAGKGGDDSGEALARIGPDLLDQKPDIVFVMLGGNDCRHWGRTEPAVAPEQYRKNITRITDLIRAGGGRVVLLSYPRSPELDGADLEVFQAINRQLKAAADSLGTGYLDIFSLLDGQDQQEIYAVDRIHQNPKAHLLIARQILGCLAGMEV